MATTGAILGRLTHRIHILEANGESYRLHEPRRRLQPSSLGDVHSPERGALPGVAYRGQHHRHSQAAGMG